MLNILLIILWRAEEGDRKERERKHIIDYIILRLIMIMNYKEAMSDKASNLIG
jgi:hypothetical protein